MGACCEKEASRTDRTDASPSPAHRPPSDGANPLRDIGLQQPQAIAHTGAAPAVDNSAVLALQEQVAALTKIIQDQQKPAEAAPAAQAPKALPPASPGPDLLGLHADDDEEEESGEGNNIMGGVMAAQSRPVAHSPAPSPPAAGRSDSGGGASAAASTPPVRRGRQAPPPPPQPAPPPPPRRGKPPPPPPEEECDADFDFKEKPYVHKKSANAEGERVRTLLLIGETGSGKSTLVNAMANYCAGVKYGDNVRYRLVVEPARDQAFSQTQEVTSYLVECEKFSYTLRLIDTPGFGDTSGVERDEAITRQIYDTLQGEQEIHGVCFVAAASLPRLTVTQQYIINKVLTMFGTDSVANIFLLVTFADGKKAQVLNAIKASGFPYADKSCFHFNNSALFARGDDRNEYSKNFWKMGEASLERFFKMLSTQEPFNLTKTKDVISTQKKLQNYVASITPQVTIGLSKMDNLRNVLQDIKVNRHKIDENKNYTYSETIPKVERKKKRPGTYNTQCLKCSYNCHHDCTRNNDDDKQYCCAMDANGNCTVCPDNCHWTEHANLDYYFEWSVQNVNRQYDTKKLQLTDAKEGLSRSEALKNRVLSELQEVYDSVHGLMTSIHQAHAKLDEIALRPTNLQWADYLKLLVEQEKLHKREGFNGRIEQLHLMLSQAQIRDDIVSKKYDPISEWKSNVERELENLDPWQEPEEGGVDIVEDEGDSGPSTSDSDSSDETSDDEEDEQVVYEGVPWQPRPAYSQQCFTPSAVETPNLHRGGAGGVVPDTPAYSTPGTDTAATTPSTAAPRRYTPRSVRPASSYGMPGGPAGQQQQAPSAQGSVVQAAFPPPPPQVTQPLGSYAVTTPVAQHNDPRSGMWSTTPGTPSSTPATARRHGGRGGRRTPARTPASFDTYSANGGGGENAAPLWDGML